MEEEDRVAAIFKGREIFITGGSGFMGKVFVERLLRQTEIGKIYLLMRHKKGKDSKERLKTLVDDMIFDVLKKQMSTEDIMKKIHIITGDCEELGLAISDEERKLITDNVTIIYHFAATIRFDEKLKKAVLMNTRGTREMIKLAVDCKKLELFAHMSTSYCHLHVSFLLEKPYDPPANPHEIIDTIESMSDKDIEDSTNKILKKYDLPNTYAFTKSLAEALVVEARDKYKLPVMIFRPSIVISTWKEPFPGYADNISGTIGIVLAAGKGVFRSAYIQCKSYGDFIPCDVAINAVLGCTWNFYAYYNPDHFIINFTSSQEIRISWEELLTIGLEVVLKKACLNQILWFPNVKFTKVRWLHKARTLVYQKIPAYIIDFLFYCFGYERFMVKVQDRLEKGMDVLEYYANNQWNFDNQIQCLFKNRLNSLEQERYKVNSKGISISEYYTNSSLGIRRYVLKTPDEMLPAAIKESRNKFIIHRTCQVLVYSGLSYWLYLLMGALFSGASLFPTLLKIALCLFLFIL